MQVNDDLNKDLNINKDKWKEARTDVRKAWDRLTDDEIDKTKGDFNAMSGLIQQRYKDATSTPEEKLTGIFKKYEFKQ